MPLSFRQAGNLFVAGPNISIYPSGNSFAISGSASGSIVGIESISTIGSGTFSIASSVTNNNLVYRSLSASTNFGIIEAPNGTLTFTTTTPTTILSGRNASTGVEVFCGTTTINNTNDTLSFYTLSGGSNVSVTTNDSGEIVIDRGQVVINTISNQEAGARIFSAITGNSLVSRTIPASSSGFTTALGAGIISPTSSTDSDATAFITAASITDSRQITAIQNLVSDLKTNNLWNKMLAVYPLVGGNANSHKYNLKDPRDLDAAYRLDFGPSNVIHDSNGIRTNAAAATSNPTINTFINLRTISSLTDNIHLSFYNRINFLYAGGAAAGGNVGNTAGNSAFFSYPRGGGGVGTWQITIGSSAFTGAYPNVPDNSLGFYIASRTSSTGNTFYKNGFLSAITSPTVHLSGISGNILLLRYANNPENTGQYAFFSFGSGLTNSEALAYTTIIENYQTTLGRQVITLQNQTVRITPTNTTADRFYTIGTGPVLNVSSLILPTASAGTMAISATPVTTSRLLIQSGTSAVSQIRLTPFLAEPTNPSNGSIWYSTSGNTLKFEKDTIATDFIFKDNNLAFSGASNILVVDTGGTITPSYINTFGHFSSLSSRTLTDPTSETSIITSSLIGTTTLLSSTNQYTPELVRGRKCRFNAKGTLVTSSLVNLTLRLKLGSTIIGLVNAYGLANPINGYFEIDFTFTIRSTGASGRVFGSGKILSDTTLKALDTNSYPIGIYTNTTTIDTTSNQIFDCTVENDGAGMTMTITESSLEFLT